MELDAKIWGPHYWFVLHTIALNYPLFPNETIKKKYYDFIQNLPLFIPIVDMGNAFSLILDSYPVTPYLDSRESFIKWMHFIHNKINLALGIPEKTLEETLRSYYELYKLPEITVKENIIKKEKYLYILVIVLLVLVSIVIYKK
uniref:thiol oxidase n=1 Tax=viral metagenome TaxID=1070528 RepID=A0A6C0AZ65_9ZZZZ|tara:strand:+ start:559 stop:990 length:432 start_codon:yes stop_codon:yes gene_type:complete